MTAAAFAGPPRSRPSAAALWSRAGVAILLAILYVDVLGGLLRYVLSSAGLSQLYYLPFLAAAAYVGLYALSRIVRLKIVGLAAVAVILIVLLIALLLGRSAGAALFGLYVWTPFFLGFVLMLRRQEGALLRHALPIWGIAVAGVLLNAAVPFPWAGLSYDVLGYEVQTAVAWRAWEYERLAGFSRASFAAANQIAVMGCLIIAMPIGKLLRVAIWLVSLLAIALTTTKTPLLVMAVVPALMLGYDFVRLVRGRSRAPYFLAMAGLAALTALVVFLPVGEGLRGLFDPNARVSFFSFASVDDRLARTWPQAFDLIARDRIDAEWALGRGLGGIGIAQRIDEPLRMNPADNMFVYVYVGLGLLGAALFALIFRGFWRLYRDDEPAFRILLLMAAAVLTLGITTNVVESVLPCALLGLLVGKAFLPRSPRPVLRP